MAVVLGLLLVGCSSAPPEVRPAPTRGPDVAGQPASAPGRRTPPAQRDACGAAALQGLVGQPRSEIPVPLDPNRQRVACTTCPVTLDFSPERLNFFFDADTGLIKEIRCG